MVYAPIERATLWLYTREKPNSAPVFFPRITDRPGQVELLLEQVSDLGFEHVHFADSEFSQIPELADWAGILSSRGVAVTARTRADLSSVCLQPLEGLLSSLYIDLHGHGEQHDRAIGSKGDYRRRLSFVANTTGIPIVIVFRLTPHNQTGLQHAYKEAVRAGASGFILAPAVSVTGGPLTYALSDSPLILELMRQLRELGLGIDPRIVRGWLPVKTLLQHPCNGFACYNHNCHSKKGTRPRQLVVGPDGYVWAENGRVSPLLRLGNIHELTLSDILNRWPGSDLERTWLNLCRRVFSKYVMPCPFSWIPWSDLITRESWMPDMIEVEPQ